MKKEIILVSGLSGAGKTTASTILEDMGYQVIDQFPVQLLSLLIDLIKSTTDIRYDHTALTMPLSDYAEFYRFFSNEEMELDVFTLFLDANDEELLHRYKFTRRTHPLLVSNKVASLQEAIEYERSIFEHNKDRVTAIIDTTFIDKKKLKERMEKMFKNPEKTNLALSFESFGYKYGVPLDADVMLDVRFLPNPFWDVNLRLYSGNDDNVYHFVMDKPETQSYLAVLIPFLDHMMEAYLKEGKSHFTIAVGCTGGQHRSVSLANYLYNYYKDKYTSYCTHRDVKEKNLNNE